MRALVQRVSSAAVETGGRQVGVIGRGMLVLLGVGDEDDDGDRTWLAGKVARMRIFSDAEGKMNLALADIDGGVLVVSQFTLHASTQKGNRPSFLRSAAPEWAEPMYEAFCAELESLLGRPVGRGVFGADMQVSLVNDGPVTVWIDSRARE